MRRDYELFRYVEYDDYIKESPNSIEYVEIFPAVDYIPIAPSFLLGAVSSDVCDMVYSAGRTNRVGFYTVRGARVTRDNIVIHKNNVLTGTSVNFPHYHCVQTVPMVKLDIRVGSKVIAGKVVSLAGPGWATWGHWLVDFLPRIYLFRRLGWDLSYLKWLLPAKVPNYVYQFLELLGIDQASLILYDHDHEIFEFEQLIVPENMAAYTAMHPCYVETISWMSQQILRNSVAGASDIRKLFISRGSNPEWRELKNRSQIETIAQDFGYTIIEPSRMSVIQQVNLFRNATHMAGEYGSGLHTSIFAPRGAVITCLRGSGLAAGFLQSGLAQSAGQKIGYVIGQADLDDSQCPFSIEPQQAEAGLRLADRLSQ